MRSESWQKLLIFAGFGVGALILAREIWLEQKKRKRRTNAVSVETTLQKLEVPKRHLGYLIGKKGAVIKRIRQDTGANIKLTDLNDELALVEIKGSEENVESATKEVKRLLNNNAHIQGKEFTLPESTWPSVVGINGDNVKHICSETKAIITVKWLTPNEEEIDTKSCKYVVTVRGTKDQIEHALSLIDERVAQASVVQSNNIVGVVGRYLLDNVVPNVENTVTRETFPNSSGDGFVQVFVSAVQSPSHFWVQLCGPKSVQLDKLTTEMTEFYSRETTNQTSSYIIQSVIPGDLVAAFYDGDNDWYRALVLSVEKLSSNKLSATVLFVDFGDSAVVNLGQIMKLKPEYLSIPLQAIKCSLHNILPVETEWSQDAIKKFETITHLAQWKPIMAKPIYDTSRTSSVDIPSLRGETPDIVSVVLVDTNSSIDIVISKELLEAGHAIEKQKHALSGSINSINSNFSFSNENKD